MTNLLIAPTKDTGIPDSAYRAARSLYGTLTGETDQSGQVMATGFDDDSVYFWTIQNQGSGGHLNIPNVMAVGSTAVTFGVPVNLSSDLTVGGNLQVNGSSVLGNAAGDTTHITGPATLDSTLNVTGASTLGVLGAGATTVTTLHATGATTLDGAVTLGDAAGDAITFNGTPSFLTAVTFAGNVTVNGDTVLGDANTDLLTVVGVTTFRNAANTATQLFVDAANNRVIAGSGTALGTDTTPNLQVVGRLYVAPESANDFAIQVRRSSAATVGWSIGVESTIDLIFKDDAGTSIVRIGDAASTYQLDVVAGDFHVADDAVIAGDISCDRAVVGGTTFSGSEKLRVVGTARIEGAVTVTTGGATITGGIVLASSGNIDGNSGTAGQIRIGAVIVNAASLDGTEELLVNGQSKMKGDVAITTGALAMSAGTTVGFYGATPSSQLTVTGSRAGNAALASLLTHLNTLGLLANGSSA